jgi:outer membrane lipoprotein-sorting protein
MRVCYKLSAYGLLLFALIGCRERAALPDPNSLLTRAGQAWHDDWHAVWQVEWAGAPLRGPLVAEVWHAADGRLRIEVLEAPSAALSGLTLVTNGTTGWLYDVRQDRTETGPAGQVRIPLASDALDAMDWLFSNVEGATVVASGYDRLESGQAIRLEIRLAAGDRAELWVHGETSLPARLELRSADWGEASFTTRSIAVPERLPADLFLLP